jgi:CheY-like chemotaxis protein
MPAGRKFVTRKKIIAPAARFFPFVRIYYRRALCAYETDCAWKADMKILLAEDDRDLCDLLKKGFVKAGHEVVTARNGEEACRLMLEGPVDALVTDILMPEKDGLDVIREFKRRQPTALVVAISGGGPGVATHLCLHLAHHLGAAQILRKPFTMAELLNAVEGPGSSPGSGPKGPNSPAGIG